MDERQFAELKESISQMKAIIDGEAEPARATTFDVPDVAAIRTRMGLTQSEFATVLGISTRTLQEWEQGRRTPRGPARSLLLVARHAPDVVLESVRAGIVGSDRAPEGG